jgi:hypothetical protein
MLQIMCKSLVFLGPIAATHYDYGTWKQKGINAIGQLNYQSPIGHHNK